MKEENVLKQIDVNHLVWQPEKKQSPVLSDVTAMLTSGRFYGIIGPNGAGKTSFVRQLLGLQDRNRGSVMLDEKNIENISRQEMAEKMSFLPQNTNYSVEFTVFDMVAMGREPHRRFFAPLDGEDMDKIEEAMVFTNCSNLRDRKISQISGGERQRVMIARTIAQDTPWVILDEPISNLDIRHQTELMQVLDRLRREKKKTIVVILHDINLAASFCSHIILMKDGNICREGMTEEVLIEENLRRAYEIEFDFIRYPDRAMPYIVPRISESHVQEDFLTVQQGDSKWKNNKLHGVGNSKTEEKHSGKSSEEVVKQAKLRWDSIAKPIDSLGLLEDDIVKICKVFGTAKPCDIGKRALIILCGDHGVVEEGVTQTGNDVTRIVSENFAKGCSTVNYMAKKAGVDIYTVDVGMSVSAYTEKKLVQGAVIDRKVAAGTANIAKEEAMSLEQCQQTVEAGVELVRELKDMGYRILAAGEMGIGNTTPTAALAAVFLSLPVEKVTGRGAGLPDDGLMRKRQVVQRALDRVKEKDLMEPMEILAEVGGYEIAGMVGIFLGSVKYSVPIVIDGAISAVSALVAARIDQRVPDYVIASHQPVEAAGKFALEALGAEALIHGRMHLGEGTGAVALFPLLDMAMEVYAKMGSFADYDIEAYTRFHGE